MTKTYTERISEQCLLNLFSLYFHSLARKEKKKKKDRWAKGKINKVCLGSNNEYNMKKNAPVI